MASVWIVKRPTKSGKSRYRVEWRGGGREAPTRYGGSFKTLREAEAQKKWFELEFASQRVPDLKKLEPPAPVETFEMVAERWRQSRVDVAGGTAQTHVVNLARIVPRIGICRSTVSASPTSPTSSPHSRKTGSHANPSARHGRQPRWCSTSPAFSRTRPATRA